MNIINIIDLLKVYYYKNKIRLGINYDGGYVIAEINNPNYDCYISAGVSDEESFSRDFINKYNMNKNNSFAFDGTIINYPYKYTKNITFIKRNIGYNRNENEANLSFFIEKYCNIFLKMDIEGSEYLWLDYMDKEKLQKFKQIVIEFHGINNDSWNVNNCDKIKCIEKLIETHYIIHIHGNNYGNITNDIPDTIEVTFLRKDLFDIEPELNKEKLPIYGLDFPNNPNSDDFNLNFPPFTN